MIHKKIPIVDLFAGPGGLGEGFSAVRDEQGNRIFDIKISIEKDSTAQSTLLLRSLFRKLEDVRVPDAYYDYIEGRSSKQEFSNNASVADAYFEASTEAFCLELGNDPDGRIDELIRKAIGQEDDWVLIGGPPCQAYSMAGRSRRRKSDPLFESDPKHFLYKEYLRIIRNFKPAVFVMENVKGMISSTLNGKKIFHQIINDLSEPAPGVYYDVRSFVTDREDGPLKPDDFIIQSEDHNVPQTRHRVILLGIRADRSGHRHRLLEKGERVDVVDALSGLPQVRSKLSKEPDSHAAWLKAMKETRFLLKGWRSQIRSAIEDTMSDAIGRATNITSVGAAFLEADVQVSIGLPKHLSQWTVDKRLNGVCLHETRNHMRSDIHRYFFASSFATTAGYSTRLDTYPESLLPNHRNVDEDTTPFQDRFRVQIYNWPATTVVSHIAKDGHYYIHPDPAQCRSFTVREAARIQTFPDNYFFEGTRTHQYHQVGNAVPPFLAKQLGETVAEFLRQPKTANSMSKRSTRQQDLFCVV